MTELNSWDLGKSILSNDGALALRCAREINSWNGDCDWSQVFELDELIDMYCSDTEATKELIRAIVYSPTQNIGSYECVRYNAYANLEGIDEYGLEQEASEYADEIIDELIDNCSDMDWDYIDNEKLKQICNGEYEITIVVSDIEYEEGEKGYDKDSIEFNTYLYELDELDEEDEIKEYILDVLNEISLYKIKDFGDWYIKEIEDGTVYDA